MQLNSLQKEIITLGLILLNPITMYWYWSFYANFYFVENLLYFICASSVLVFAMSFKIKTANAISVIFRGVVCAFIISLGQKLIGGLMDGGSFILLKESSIITLFLDAIFMSVVLPFLIVAVIGLFALRKIKNEDLRGQAPH